MASLSPRHVALGLAIREGRMKRDLTQEDLAERTGLSANYIGDLERGERNVSIRALWQVADGLGVPASELMRPAEKGRRGKRKR
jgi:transcriptional regulator with XRE-family HTH domain